MRAHSPTAPTLDELTTDVRGGLPEYLTAAQVGAMLQLSAKSIYRLARADATLPQLKLMGSVRFPRERLLRWLRAREGRPVSFADRSE
jgi:predicted DNA-binding transcriptional regulator AlpA